MTGERARWIGCGAMMALALWACAESQGPAAGGESHFLSQCEGDCPGELDCVCGVCTRGCSRGDECGAFAEGAVCMAAGEGNVCAARDDLAVCDVPCGSGADCAGLGDYACTAGVCRARASGSDGGSAPVSSSSAGEPGGVLSAASEGPPAVMWIVDTSGSLERRVGCECEDAACQICTDGLPSLPDCAAGERNRWATLLEVLTGSFQGFSCEARERTATNGMTYDLGYYLDYHQPDFDSQAADGILDRYAGSVRFGLGTFDGWDTYVGAPPLVPASDFDWEASSGVDGLWSVGALLDGEPRLRADGSRVGVFHYPMATTDYRIDTGLRSDAAAEGWLVLPGEGTAPDVERSLLGARPYGGTPIAASLDDLNHVLGASGETAADPANRHAILITDGHPDDDYRSFGCDCVQNDDSSADGYCGGPEGMCDDPATCSNHPANMRCPYPTPEEAARILVEGDGGGEPALARLFVVGFSVPEGSGQGDAVFGRLDAIAAAGGTGSARHAADAGELRRQLEAILDDVGGAP